MRTARRAARRSIPRRLTFPSARSRSVSIYCGTHTTALPERQAGLERALPVKIGRDSWIGGGVTIMAGVTIGRGCTIGAASTVTRDIPDFSVAVGTPAKVVKMLEGEERGSLA